MRQVCRSRSCGYCKSDNTHVEQKNGARARTLSGHGRIVVPGLIDLLNEINALDGFIKTLYIPSVRLVSKELEGTTRKLATAPAWTGSERAQADRGGKRSKKRDPSHESTPAAYISMSFSFDATR